MIYVCSDIHGRLDRYKRALSYIKSNDELYILGDVIDRHPSGVDILLDLVNRNNIHFILGNHELMMLDYLLWSSTYYGNAWVTVNNGGIETLQKFMGLDKDRQTQILSFLFGSPLFMRVTVNDRQFYLAHGSYQEKYKRRGSAKLSDIVIFEDIHNIVWQSPFDIEKPQSTDRYSKDETYILGHRYVQIMGCNSPVILNDNIYDIDGGCALRDASLHNSLILLRLDDMRSINIV